MLLGNDNTLLFDVPGVGDSAGSQRQQDRKLRERSEERRLYHRPPNTQWQKGGNQTSQRQGLH